VNCVRLITILVLLCLGRETFGAESPVEYGPWSGAVTSNSVTVKAKLAKEGAVARLVVSRNFDFTQPISSAADQATAAKNKIVALSLTNLQPGALYYYGLAVDGYFAKEKRGQFRTFPVGASSFTFAFASCARSGSSSPVFGTILKNQPLFFLNDGDLHYENIKINDRAKFRAAYDYVLSSPAQALLYRMVPLVYIWDDHDFGGDNSNQAASGHLAARLTYEEYLPHYPLAAGAGNVPIYQAFSVGRVRFILTDLRSERSPSEQTDDARKTMMGEKQKAWFKNELIEANGKYPLTFWVSSVPWLGQTGTNYYPVPTNYSGFIHHKRLPPLPVSQGVVLTSKASHPPPEDHWSVYATERREIADFIKDNKIKGVCILHGDAHMLAADDGSNADFATGGGAPIPVLAAAPLDQHPSIKGGPYSQGVYTPRKNEGCFGLVRVIDEGDRLKVAFSGRNHLNEEKISLRFEVPVKPIQNEQIKN